MQPANSTTSDAIVRLLARRGLMTVHDVAVEFSIDWGDVARALHAPAERGKVVRLRDERAASYAVVHDASR